MRPELLKGNLDLLLLSILKERPAHGYAIIEELRARSDKAFDLPEGTVYPALHRMERAGLLTSHWSDGEGRRRRVYQVSGLGEQALAAKQAEWQKFNRSVRLVLEGS
ncbi:MAG: helix-turn-helix transcriptional regulator [Dehalococcoidia bacterium]